MQWLLLLFIIQISFFPLHAQKYKNGTFEGSSQSVYKEEPFVAHVKITIIHDSITDIKFWIVDTAKNEVFDEKYERHYRNYPDYVQQCRNDWKGVQLYPKIYLSKQKISRVDAISGATWSFNMFTAALNEALKLACKSSK